MIALRRLSGIGSSLNDSLRCGISLPISIESCSLYVAIVSMVCCFILTSIH